MNSKSYYTLAIFVCAFCFWSIEARAQYLPSGPQKNVPVDTVTGGGWTQCYIDTYDNFMNAAEVLAQCPGGRLMLACRETGSETLTLLAQGERSDVTFDTGEASDVTHIANGVGWYFNISGYDVVDGARNAWGFVRAGNTVIKDNCDVDTSGANDERLCWHIQRTNGGYRCGENEKLNDVSRYERIVYTSGSSGPIVIVPTLSEWGLIALAGILAIAGFVVMRRSRVIA